MNICTIKQNLGSIVLQYIITLTKCEKLHTKLENLYFKMEKKTNSFVKNEIFKINNTLNKLFVEIMNYQWLIELFCPTCKK